MHHFKLIIFIIFGIFPQSSFYFFIHFLQYIFIELSQIGSNWGPRESKVKTLKRISLTVGVRESNHRFKMRIASQQPKKIILCEVRVGGIPLA